MCCILETRSLKSAYITFVKITFISSCRVNQFSLKSNTSMLFGTPIWVQNDSVLIFQYLDPMTENSQEVLEGCA